MTAAPARPLAKHRVAALGAAVCLAAPGTAVAQMPSIFSGGVTVTTTQPQPVTPPAPAPKAAPKAAAPAQAKPKPKPKPVQTASTATDAGSGRSIVLLVNDEPVTAYEIDMRTRFLAMSSGGQQIQAAAQESFKRMVTTESTNERLKGILEQTIRENQGKSREEILKIFERRKLEFAQGLQRQAIEGARAAQLPRFRKDAHEELVEEKLKLQEARRLGVLVPDEDVNKVIKGIAERNKLTEAQFAQNIASGGSNISVMRQRFQAALSWREVVRRRFAGQISINQRDVDRFLSQTAKPDDDKLELQIQKITLPLPGKLDQAALAQRLADADGLRRKFAGCASTARLAAGINGARFEDLKYVRPSTLGEPVRSFLLAAKDGEMLPPQTATAGTEIYTVCGRRELKHDPKKLEEAQQEVQSREFERLANRLLRDLRQDASCTDPRTGDRVDCGHRS
jgi:peptidyl-prolyl cis-trans isomerase SurA